MTKKFRAVKTVLILGILLFGIIGSFIPTTSAGLIGLNSYVDVTWKANATAKPIVPRGEMRQVDLEIRYGSTQGGILAQTFFPFHLGRQVNIKLEIIEKSSWCTAGLKSGTITTSIHREEQTLETLINLRVDENAPAYSGGFVRVKASIEKIGLIDGIEQEFYLEFTPEYLPLISTQIQDSNTQRIGPMDIAVFPIEITNLGNARTKVFLEVELSTLPDDWIAIVDDSIIIDEGEGSKNIAYLTIRPPKSLGYHDDPASIRVKMTPARAENTQNRGEPEYVTVIVESRGVSIIGLEVIAPVVIVIVAVILAILYFFMRKRKT